MTSLDRDESGERCPYGGVPECSRCTEREVRRLATEVYTPEGVEVWMRGRKKSLRGLSPIELIETGYGNEVIGAIKALGEGAFA